MKKLLTIIAIVLPLIYLTSCKDDTVQPKNDPVLEFVSKTDSVTHVSGPLLVSDAVVKNISDHQVIIKIKMEIITLIPGQIPFVCMGGLCYPPSYVDKIFPGEITLDPQQVTTKTNYIAELDGAGNVGTSIIRYKFIPDGDTTKAISYITKYNVIAG
jgi:hypothetical protein